MDMRNQWWFRGVRAQQTDEAGANTCGHGNLLHKMVLGELNLGGIPLPFSGVSERRETKSGNFQGGFITGRETSA